MRGGLVDGVGLWNLVRNSWIQHGKFVALAQQILMCITSIRGKTKKKLKVKIAMQLTSVICVSVV